MSTLSFEIMVYFKLIVNPLSPGGRCNYTLPPCKDVSYSYVLGLHEKPLSDMQIILLGSNRDQLDNFSRVKFTVKVRLLLDNLVKWCAHCECSKNMSTANIHCLNKIYYGRDISQRMCALQMFVAVKKYAHCKFS